MHDDSDRQRANFVASGSKAFIRVEKAIYRVGPEGQSRTATRLGKVNG